MGRSAGAAAGPRSRSAIRYAALKTTGLKIPALWPSLENEIAMSRHLLFPSSVKRDPAIEVWMREHLGELGAIAQRWLRSCATAATMFESYCMTAIRLRA